MATPPPPPLQQPLLPATSVRFTAHTRKRIRAAVGRLQWSEADVLRLLIDVGLAHLEIIDYDVARAIIERAQALKKITPKISR
jgi:hypothetical protein